MKFNFEKQKKYLERNLFLSYTLIFAVTAFLTFFCFLINGKTFVWQSDGYSQHFKALYFYAKWMREIVKNLIFKHELFIPTFSLNMGLGSDLFTTLQYYVIGDPFTYLSILIPSKYMVHYYDFMIVLRLYCAGLAFCAYCLYKKQSGIATITGSLVYIFCSFAIFASIRHPYFINPMIYFPLLLLGVEKIWNEKKPLIMIASVSIAAMSNFYFFYALVLIVVIYVAVVFCCSVTKENIKQNLISILRIFSASLCGLLIAAVFFVPVTLFFLQDNRKDALLSFNFFYNVSYYERFLRDFITVESPGVWAYTGISAAALPAIFLFFKKKGFKTERIFFIVLFVALLLPIFGHISNGFSYVSNRWCWGFAFIEAYILVLMWNDLFSLKKGEIKHLAICFFIYTFISTLAWHNVNENFYFSLCVALSAFVILIWNPIIAKRFFFCLIIIGITGNAFYQYSVYQNKYVSEFKERKGFYPEFQKTEALALKDVRKNFRDVRYSGTTFVSNGNLISGVKNTQIYWSLINGNINNFYDSTLTSYTGSPFSLYGLDSRTTMEELVSTNYFITTTPDYIKVPYGYELQKEVDLKNYKKFSVYKNKNPLPFGYTYNSFITEEDALSLSPLERQEMMLQSIVLKDRISSVNRTQKEDLIFSDTPIEYEISCSSKNIVFKDKCFYVTAKNQKAIFKLKGAPEKCESYLDTKDLHFTGIPELDLYNDDESIDPTNLYGKEDFIKKTKIAQNGIRLAKLRYSEPTNPKINLEIKYKNGKKTNNSINLQTPKYTWYTNRKDFLTNLYYNDSPVTTVTLTFPQIGKYKFDDLKIHAVEMKNYNSMVSALKKDALKKLDFHENKIGATNTITGNISLEENKILCLSVPYSKGWRAYVDDEQTEFFKANYGFMALELEKGEHEIKFIYHTPGLKLGFIISLISLLAAIAFFVLQKNYSNV